MLFLNNQNKINREIFKINKSETGGLETEDEMR